MASANSSMSSIPSLSVSASFQIFPNSLLGRFDFIISAFAARPFGKVLQFIICICILTCHFAFFLLESVEDFIVLRLLPLNYPTSFVHTFIDANPSRHDFLRKSMTGKKNSYLRDQRLLPQS